MTRVEAHYEFEAPFEEGFAESVGELHAVYGLQSVQLNQELNGLSVIFDASRLKPEDVDHVLRRNGLPVRRIGG
jgi:hypothetical protein